MNCRADAIDRLWDDAAFTGTLLSRCSPESSYKSPGLLTSSDPHCQVGQGLFDLVDQDQ